MILEPVCDISKGKSGLRIKILYVHNKVSGENECGQKMSFRQPNIMRKTRKVMDRCAIKEKSKSTTTSCRV